MRWFTLAVLVLILFVVLGMGWKPQKPLPKPDAPEIKSIFIKCVRSDVSGKETIGEMHSLWSLVEGG